MELVVTENIETLAKTFKLTINRDDMQKAKITPFDRMLFADCEKEESTIADKILALETLVRRIEEGSR